jgi:hypothetical protein
MICDGLRLDKLYTEVSRLVYCCGKGYGYCIVSGPGPGAVLSGPGSVTTVTADEKDAKLGLGWDVAGTPDDRHTLSKLLLRAAKEEVAPWAAGREATRCKICKPLARRAVRVIV